MFDRSLTLFRLFGFRVGVDVSWLLLAVLIVWTLSVGYFPQSSPGLEPATYWAMGVAGLLGLAVSIVLHELAHAVVARQYDMPIRGITLFVFGGVAEMEDEPTSAKGEFLMAIAGPIMSLGLAITFYLLVLLIPGGVSLVEGEMALSAQAVVLLYLAGINCILAVFNMVPAFPLDGGRMLRAALWAWKNDILWATRIAARAGWAFGFLLMASGLFAFVTGRVIGGIWWFILGLFVQMAASSHLEHQVRRSILAGIPVSAVMRRDPISVAPALTIDRLLNEYFLRHYFKDPSSMTGASSVASRWMHCATKQVPRSRGSRSRTSCMHAASTTLSRRKPTRAGPSTRCSAEGGDTCWSRAMDSWSVCSRCATC